LGARELPQETGQEYALHHNKGCYIGQEIVERIHARGQVHRRFTGLILESKAVARGSRVMAGEKEVGEITSGAEVVVDAVARTVALGYVRRDAAAKVEGQTGGLSVGESAARITGLPFQF
jgi:folate-binding protein YgfZ